MSTEKTTILVHVQPGASRGRVVRFAGGAWYIRVAAPPVEGRANKALIELLSESLDTAKSNLSIIRGQTSRQKTVLIEGIGPEQVNERLKRLVSESGEQQGLGL